jgi:hypothetical protein
MDDLNQIVGLSSDETQRLKGQGIETCDELWSRLKGNFAETVKQLSTATKIGRARLIEILRDSGGFGGITLEEAEKLFQHGIKTIESLKKRAGVPPYAKQVIHVFRPIPMQALARTLLTTKINEPAGKLSTEVGIEAERLIEIISAHLQIRDFILLDGSGFEGFTPTEIEALFSHEIRSLDDLWAELGREVNAPKVDVAAELGIEREKLIEFLTEQGQRESESSRSTWLSRNWLNLIMIFAPILIGALVWRATGGLSFLPSTFSLQSQAVFATRNFEPGHVFREGDVYTARATYHRDFFQQQSDLEGLTVDQSAIRRGKPIRRGDVLRLQVVALKDIPAGTLITADAVGAKWTKYDADAALDASTVAGRQAAHALRSGDVILAEFIK